MDETQAVLIDEYSQSIETSTLLAIISDYELSDPKQLLLARQTLEILKTSASGEESTGFDPSGAGGFDFPADDQSAGEGDESPSASQRGWRSHTDDTSITPELDALGSNEPNLGGRSIGENTETPYSSELDNLDEAGKENALIAIFPVLKPFDIKWTLKKCKFDAGQAIDELMTQAFLEESGSRHRGIEAFSESEIVPRQRKGKGKKKRGAGRASNPTSPSNPSEDSPIESRWDIGKQDVEFLSNRTGFPRQQITSIYHKNGGSLRASITAIIEAHAAMKVDIDDPIIQINGYELHQEFPSISTSDLEILLQITQPSISDAHDLAQALAAPTSKKGAIHVEIRHAPLKLDPESSKETPKLHSAVYPDRPFVDISSPADIASQYSQQRNAAFSQAHSAYRKGKSNPLMGGAAAYYSQLGRDLDAKVKAAESAAADEVVASQSTRLQLDLHGMSVKDAVRISREAVIRWWHEVGECRAYGREGAPSVYKIVTGAGNHSSGGHGKLGPAVSKMLMSEGWTIQVGSRGNNGFLLVTGVAKRR